MTKTTNFQNESKILSIEWLRGIAALGVCIMHIFCALEYFNDEEILYQKYIFPLAITGRLGVPIFFVISGFILPYSMYKRGYKITDFFNFIVRRLLRLEPPYIVSIVLALVTAIIAYPILNGKPYQIDWFGIGLHFGYLNVFTNKPWINPVYWTLAVEFQYYILIGLIFPLLNKFRSYYGLEYLFLIAISQAVYLQVQHQEMIFKYFHIFILGFLTFRKFVKEIHTISFIVLSGICLYFIFEIHAKAYAVFSLLTSLIILFNISINNKYLYKLGDISYSLYLTHWFIGVELLRNIYVHFYPEANTISKLLVGSIICIICLIFSIIFYEFIEKPSIRFTRNFLPQKEKRNIQKKEEVLESIES